MLLLPRVSADEIPIGVVPTLVPSPVGISSLTPQPTFGISFAASKRGAAAFAFPHGPGGQCAAYTGPQSDYTALGDRSRRLGRHGGHDFRKPSSSSSS